MKVAFTLSSEEEDYGLEGDLEIRIGTVEMPSYMWLKAAKMMALEKGVTPVTPEKKYTAAEVSAMLCEGCRAKLPIFGECNSFSIESHWTHLINGVHVPCAASDWLRASAEVKQ